MQAPNIRAKEGKHRSLPGNQTALPALLPQRSACAATEVKIYFHAYLSQASFVPHC